jgi:hypothetical protein
MTKYSLQIEYPRDFEIDYIRKYFKGVNQGQRVSLMAKISE